jgi:predicted nuclease with TOPRIM domain
MLQSEFIEEELESIAEECSEYEEHIMEDETLLDAFDGDRDSLYELRFMFSDLSARCSSLHEALRSTYVTSHFNDLFVGIVGNKYHIVGYDSFEEDYFSLTDFGAELAQNESAKRLMKLTKETMISVCGQCFGVAISLLDIRHTFECLESALELLRGNRAALLSGVREIEAAYEAAEQRDFKYNSEADRHFDELLWRLPDRVWIG